VGTDPAVVATPYGELRGVVRPSGKRVFLKIPFAAPPVRFAPPPPPAAWSGTRDATLDPPGCLQLCEEPPYVCPAVISEDCLFLNIWTPPKPKGAPVIVFFHGGRYTDGGAGGLRSGLLYHGAAFNEEGAILVVAQYRLGAAGWLATSGGDEGGSIQGNAGLLDQEAALKWVQTCISAFGGDPDRVLLAGQSAGAESVALHLVRPNGGAGTTFHSAALDSAPLSLALRNPLSQRRLARILAFTAGCDYMPPRAWGDVESCLRNLPAKELLAAQRATEAVEEVDLPHIIRSVGWPWGPTLGTELLPESPYTAFSRGAVGDVPLLLGRTWNESVLFVYAVATKPLPEWEWYAAVSTVYGLRNVFAIADRYPLADKGDTRPVLSAVVTDSLFACPQRNASRGLLLAGRKSPVFAFRYDHVMSFAKEAWGPNYSQCANAACHGAELIQLFHPNEPQATYTEDEDTLSERMARMWVALAANGSPGEELPPFSAEDESILALEVGAGGVRVLHNSTRDVCSFWDALTWRESPR
jgi:para-nitrobenzyl esterase